MCIMSPLLFLWTFILFSSFMICVKMSDNVELFDYPDYVINITGYNSSSGDSETGRRSDIGSNQQYSGLDIISSKEYADLIQKMQLGGGLGSRKEKPFKESKYMMPIIIQAIAKLAHLLPVAKLTLLTLFALVLFAKKAFLISAASFAYVMYDSHYKVKKPKVTIKDRGTEQYHSYDPPYDHSYGSYYPEVYQDHSAPPQHLWNKVESYMPKVSRVYPRESEEIEDEENWKRLWKHQKNNHKLPSHFEDVDLDTYSDLYESVYQSE